MRDELPTKWLGLGPCHHMEAVLRDMPEQVPLWHETVKSTIPPKQLLVYWVKDGWEPLCDFLGVDVPAEPFPRTNQRGEFWIQVTGKN